MLVQRPVQGRSHSQHCFTCIFSMHTERVVVKDIAVSSAVWSGTVASISICTLHCDAGQRRGRTHVQGVHWTRQCRSWFYDKVSQSTVMQSPALANARQLAVVDICLGERPALGARAQRTNQIRFGSGFRSGTSTRCRSCLRKSVHVRPITGRTNSRHLGGGEHCPLAVFLCPNIYLIQNASYTIIAVSGSLAFWHPMYRPLLYAVK